MKSFYHYGSDSCLELDLKSVGFGTQAPGLNDSVSAEAIRVRHDGWANALPKESTDLWDALQTWDADHRSALFAHVVSLSVNAVHEAWNRRPRALAHADCLAQAVDLDMAAAWKPTVDNFVGRVTNPLAYASVLPKGAEHWHAYDDAGEVLVAVVRHSDQVSWGNYQDVVDVIHDLLVHGCSIEQVRSDAAAKFGNLEEYAWKAGIHR